MVTESEILVRLRRLATAPEARELRDDVAVLDGLVITHDSIAEGVHFLPFDPPASVGWKLVAVNLSDLAAKGATPAGALLALTLSGESEWESEFLTGVEAACESYGLPLIGGDTIALAPGAPRVLGLTAIGRARGHVPHRGGAEPGDRLWLVGTLGDAAAGLAQLKDNVRASGSLVDIYRRPVPQLDAVRKLAPYAHAMMDVSDGLLLDALRIAEASGGTALIELDKLPLSSDFVAARGQSREAKLFAATGGDDYALLGAFAPDFDPSTLNLLKGTTIAPIGTLEAGDPGIRLISNGQSVELPETLGHEHRGIPTAPVADRP
jgi:thiamine-monophosphate kinase